MQKTKARRVGQSLVLVGLLLFPVIPSVTAQQDQPQQGSAPARRERDEGGQVGVEPVPVEPGA